MKTIPDDVIKAVRKLLEIDLDHDRKISSIEEASDCELGGLRVDLLGVALDLLGVPPDNTVEQEEKYGHQGMIDHKDTVCRDCFGERWHEITGGGDPGEIDSFIRWVIGMEGNYLN